MPGWESQVRIQAADSWGTAGTFGKRGYFLFLDSETLSYGAQVSERDNKILGLRESPVDTFSVDRYFPRGGITFQPRTDDILLLLGAMFQNVVISGTGTYTFYPLHKVTSFALGGSRIGTNAFSLNVDLFLGQSFITTGGTQANGIRFTNGIVDKLTFTSRYGEDLMCTAEFKFLAGSYYAYPTAFAAPSVYGSFSAYSRFVDYMGTVTVAGEDYDIENWTGNFSNNTADRARVGKRGYNRFPFSGKFVADGEFMMELQRDLAVLAEGQYGSLNVNFFQAAGNQILVVQPNIANRAFDIPLNSGEEVIELTRPYRAYPPSGTTGPSTQITVYTGTTFGTALLGMNTA